MVSGLSHVALATCNKVLALRGKKRLVANYLLCKTKPVNWSTLTSSKSENQRALKNFRFAFILLRMKSQIGIDRIRLEFARLTLLSTCNQRDHWACKRRPNEVLSRQLDGLTPLVYFRLITVWLNLASECFTCPAQWLSSEVWWIEFGATKRETAVTRTTTKTGGESIRKRGKKRSRIVP